MKGIQVFHRLFSVGHPKTGLKPLCSAPCCSNSSLINQILPPYWETSTEIAKDGKLGVEGTSSLIQSSLFPESYES